jgi:hypothetical protein
MTASMKMTVFWDVKLCSLVEVYWCFMTPIQCISLIFLFCILILSSYCISLSTLMVLPFPLPFLPGCGQPLLPLAPLHSLSSPDLHSLHHWSSQGSTLSDWFPFLKTVPCIWLTHRPDDGGSTKLWNIGRLVPDYTVQHPRRESSSDHVMYRV